MFSYMAMGAQSDEVVERIVALLASVNLVVHLKVFEGPAFLAPPSVPFQDPLHQSAVDSLPQLDSLYFL